MTREPGTCSNKFLHFRMTAIGQDHPRVSENFQIRTYQKSKRRYAVLLSMTRHRGDSEKFKLLLQRARSYKDSKISARTARSKCAGRLNIQDLLAGCSSQGQGNFEYIQTCLYFFQWLQVAMTSRGYLKTFRVEQIRKCPSKSASKKCWTPAKGRTLPSFLLRKVNLGSGQVSARNMSNAPELLRSLTSCWRTLLKILAGSSWLPKPFKGPLNLNVIGHSHCHSHPNRIEDFRTRASQQK